MKSLYLILILILSFPLKAGVPILSFATLTLSLGPIAKQLSFSKMMLPIMSVKINTNYTWKRKNIYLVLPKILDLFYKAK